MHLAEIKPADYKLTLWAIKLTLQSLSAKIYKTHLCDFQPLFQGMWAEYHSEPIQLELHPGSKPFYSKPFSIPQAYQQITKDEITWLESIGVFIKVNNTEWAAPTFIVPKKTGLFELYPISEV
jgi:hypothetical protein